MVGTLRAFRYASIASRLFRSQMRQGLITRSCGESAAYVLSKRTWSLPLPVQPWQSASHPVASATSTCARAMIGRAIDVPIR